MGAELIQGQQLIASFQSFMTAPVPTRAVVLPQMNSRCGTLKVGELPDALRNFIDVSNGNGNLCSPKLSRLFKGDTSDFAGDKSGADDGFIRILAREGFTPDECDMALRASGLMRDKWDSARGRSTYGADTIKNVFAGINTRYQTASAETSKVSRLISADGVIQFSCDVPAPRDFTIGDIILMSKVCLLAGFGGVSKTQWLIQAAIHIALGIPFMGKATVAGAVLMLLGEEDQAEIARRFNAIAKAMRLTQEQIETCRQRVRAFPMVGLDMRLTRVTAGSLEGTGFAAEIMESAKQLESDCGLPVRLIGLDHAGLIHGGEFNAREDVVQTMRQVNYIAQESGAAVLVLAHSPKAAANAEKSTSGAVAGSTAWVDHARAALILRSMNDDEGKRYGIDLDQRNEYASLTVVKNNYGPTGSEFWLSRKTVEGYGVGALTHVELTVPVKVIGGSNTKLRTAIYELVKEKPCLTKNSLEGFSGAKDGRLRASKATVVTEMEIMLADGILAYREATAEERKRLNIRGNTGGFLCTGEYARNLAEKATKNA